MIKRYVENFFLVNTNEYKNIGFDLYVNLILLAITLGMCVAIFCLWYKRAAMSLLIKQLLRHEAFDEASAKSLKELSLSDSGAVRRMLLKDGQIRKMVRRVGEKRYTYEEYVALQKEKKRIDEAFDVDKGLFYVEKEEINRARSFYERFSGSVVRAVGFSVFLLIIFVCISLIVPEILAVIDQFLA